MNRRLVRRLRKLGVSPTLLPKSAQRALDFWATKDGPDRVSFTIIDTLRLEQAGFAVVWSPKRFEIKEEL